MPEDNNCPDCGHKMFVHYRRFCPVCYKPEPEMILAYDLFKCMYHVQETGNPNFKDEVWDEICKCEIQNDVYVSLHANQGVLIEKMFKELGIKEDSAVFWVSW